MPTSLTWHKICMFKKQNENNVIHIGANNVRYNENNKGE